MMAPRRVVIVLEAEKLLIPKRESKAADEEQERLEAFIQDAAADTRRWCSSAARSTCGGASSKLLAEAGAGRRLRHHRERGRRRAVGEGARGPRQGHVRAGGGAGARRARRPRHRPPARRARAGRAVRDGPADDHRRRRAAVVPAGPEAQDDFGIANAIRNGRCARGAEPAWRARSRAAASPFLCWVSCGGSPRRCRRRGCGQAIDARVPDGPRAEVVGRRPADPARAAGGGTVRNGQGGGGP